LDVGVQNMGHLEMKGTKNRAGEKKNAIVLQERAKRFQKEVKVWEFTMSEA